MSENKINTITQRKTRKNLKKKNDHLETYALTSQAHAQAHKQWMVTQSRNITPHGVREDVSLWTKAACRSPNVLQSLCSGAHRIVLIVNAREENRVEAHLCHQISITRSVAEWI